MMCIIAMRNMNVAVRAKKVAQGAGVTCSIVSLEPSLTKRGCAYGISFPPAALSVVRSALDARRVPYGEVIGAHA